MGEPVLLHADAHLLVLNKPAGLLTVPGRGADRQHCLWLWARQRFADALVVHRLDQATSGLCVLARGPAMQRTLSIAFAQRRVDKRYVAVVAGHPDADGADPEGWHPIDLPLAVDWPRRPRQRVDPERGRPSLTRWRPLPPAQITASLPGTTRLELAPLTGRSHQLRVHLAAIGHPIVGDPLYAPAPWSAATPRLLLHATALAFAHPATGALLRFEQAAPF